MINEVFEEGYVDMPKLVALLNKLFPGNHSIEVSPIVYHLLKGTSCSLTCTKSEIPSSRTKENVSLSLPLESLR